MSESEEEDWGEDDEELVVEEMGGDEAEGTGDAEPTEDVDDEANNMRMLAEEAEYEKQDAAARLLQGVVRRGQGRRYAKEYGKQCFIKEWDPEKKQYAYVDTRRSPPSKQWTKPKWLGDDDLVEETRYRAPPNYPKRRQTQRQFALVAHTAEFDDDKVPSLPSPLGVLLEHEELKERMQNPYTSNFTAKDTTFLWEPTKTIFMKSLEALRIKCQAHVDAEARMLKGRLEENFVATLEKLYDDPNSSSSSSGGKSSSNNKSAKLPPLPTWEDASNAESLLVSEPAWKAFDQFRLAMAHAKASADLAAAANAASLKAEALAQAAAQGRKAKTPPGKGSRAAAAAKGAASGGVGGKMGKSSSGNQENPDVPTSTDLQDAMQTRKKLFDDWHAKVALFRLEAAKEAEAARRAKKLLKLRAAEPGRAIEEWELDPAPGDDDDEEANKYEDDDVRERDVAESLAMRQLRAQTLEAMKRINRNRVALAASHEEDKGAHALDVFKALGPNYRALRDLNPSADRLLSLIGQDGAEAEQHSAATAIQRLWRGHAGRLHFQAHREEWAAAAKERAEIEAAEAAAAAAAEEDEARRAKRRALGVDPFDLPEKYPWDSRYPTAPQRSLAMADAAVTIYVKAHVGRLKGPAGSRGPTGRSNGAYLLFRDSNWRSVGGVQRTCLSIDSLAEAVRLIPFRQRLVVLDVVHLPYPDDDSFFKSRVLYPPANLYSELARKAECVVIGACSIGSAYRTDLPLSSPPRPMRPPPMPPASASAASSSSLTVGGLPMPPPPSRFALLNSSGSGDNKVHPIVHPDVAKKDHQSRVGMDITSNGVVGVDEVEEGDESLPQLQRRCYGVYANKTSLLSSAASLRASSSNGDDEAKAARKAAKRAAKQERAAAAAQAASAEAPGGGAVAQSPLTLSIPKPAAKASSSSLAAQARSARLGAGGGRVKGGPKPDAKLKLLPWKLENSKKSTRHECCENALLHDRRKPVQTADYASNHKRNARIAAAKAIKEAKRHEEFEAAKARAKAARERDHPRKRKKQKKEQGGEDEDSEDGDDDDDDDENKQDEQEEEEMEMPVWDGKISIFGEAFLDAVSGEAASPDEADIANARAEAGITSVNFGSGMVSVQKLFDFLAKRVTVASAKVRAEEEIQGAKDREADFKALLESAEEAGGESATRKAVRQWAKNDAKRRRDHPPRPLQHVNLWAYHPLLCTQLCPFPVPTPPPSPSAPDAASVMYRHIDVAWEVPEYDGEPAMYFECQIRELTRLTSQWAPACVYRNAEGRLYPLRRTKLRVPHLTPGIEVQFRVRARNHGGWGPFSEESVFFMAGAAQQPTTVAYMLGKMVAFGPTQLLNFLAERVNQARLPVQQLGLLQLASLGRDCTAKGAAGAALLRPSIAQAACQVALRAMRTFPWDKPVQQRACLLMVRLLLVHGPWMEKYARQDEPKRLKRVEKALRAEMELDDVPDDDDEMDPFAARNQVGLSKKEKAALKQQAEDDGILDILFALASVQLRFGRREVAMLFAVDEVLGALQRAAEAPETTQPPLSLKLY